MWKKPTNDDILTAPDFCAFVGISAAVASRHRREGTGPRFLKLGRKVFYRRDDVATWLAGQTVRSIAEVKMRKRDAETIDA